MHNGSTILQIVSKVVVCKQCFRSLNCFVLIVGNPRQGHCLNSRGYVELYLQVGKLQKNRNHLDFRISGFLNNFEIEKI
jgi:hypothetical protein